MSPAGTSSVRSSTARRWPNFFWRFLSRIIGCSFGPLKDEKILDVSIGIQIIHTLAFAPCPVECLLVEHERNLVRIEWDIEELQMVRILTVEETVPGIT